jgi:hypothetical protein
MTIREWVSNPQDFNEGLNLYKQYGTHGAMKRILAKSGDTPRNRQNLIYELRKLIGKDEALPAGPPADHKPEELNLGQEVTINKKQFLIPPAPSGDRMIVYDPDKEEQLVTVVKSGTGDDHKIYINGKLSTGQSNSLPKPSLTIEKLFKPESLKELEKLKADKYRQASYLKGQLRHMEDKEERRKACHAILNLMDELKDIWKKIEHFNQHGALPEEKIIKVETTDDVQQLMRRRNNLRTYICKASKGDRYRKPEMIPSWEAEILEIEKKLKSKNA